MYDDYHVVIMKSTQVTKEKSGREQFYPIT